MLILPTAASSLGLVALATDTGQYEANLDQDTLRYSSECRLSEYLHC